MTPEQLIALSLAASSPTQAPGDFRLHSVQTDAYNTPTIYYRVNSFTPVGRTVTILIPGERARTVFIYGEY